MRVLALWGDIPSHTTWDLEGVMGTSARFSGQCSLRRILQNFFYIWLKCGGWEMQESEDEWRTVVGGKFGNSIQQWCVTDTEHFLDECLHEICKFSA